MRVQLLLPALLVMLSACATTGAGTSSASWSVEDLGLPSASVVAGAAKPLAAGASVPGSLTEADPVLGDGTRYHVWRLDATPGRRTTITLAAQKFTPFLVVASPVGDSLEVVATQKGSEDGPARLSIEAVDRGPLYVFVNAVRTQDRGAYSLRAGAYEPPMLLLGSVPASAVRKLERSNTAVSTLGAGDLALHDRSRYQLWKFSGRKGERLTLTMASTELAPYIGYGRMVADSLIIDGQGGAPDNGNEAVLLIELERDGEHVVIANGRSANDEGRYTLRLEPREQLTIPLAAVAREKMGTLVMGEPQFATLATGDAVLPDRTHYQLWRFDGKAGESVMVTMTSSAVDPYLYVGMLEGEVLRVLKSNDDRGVGVESRVRLTLPKTGSYVVVANAVSASELGPYRLVLEKDRGAILLR